VAVIPAIVRTTRARIIYLRNDYKDVMAKVEQGIHAHFASLSEAQTALSDAAPQSPVPADIMEAEPMPSWSASTSDAIIESPFARVNSVAPGSPAAQAGMKVGDKIRSFGTVNWMNHENLTKIAQLVQQNEGVSEAGMLSLLTLY
jgi:26S proteasome non-ATPase regulatory subunit 9